MLGFMCVGIVGYVALVFYDRAVMWWRSSVVAVYGEAVTCSALVSSWFDASEWCFSPCDIVAGGNICVTGVVWPRGN